ncbi:hypothetical protein [Parasitella parasitica]|uniref:Uncharacterized protein n=1 Tax=Parasitella parasitica TaxID=35722 RepID=A0A0B7N293_9FUNG|nr:hypothetical protein [Parasitella parasitica]
MHEYAIIPFALRVFGPANKSGLCSKHRTSATSNAPMTTVLQKLGKTTNQASAKNIATSAPPKNYRPILRNNWVHLHSVTLGKLNTIFNANAKKLCLYIYSMKSRDRDVFWPPSVPRTPEIDAIVQQIQIEVSRRGAYRFFKALPIYKFLNISFSDQFTILATQSMTSDPKFFKLYLQLV